ncbi:thermonuclease family protein [Mesorhizobium huakuii]|uniref:Thermonuclease family protein n=1 Tax=Mesorhizobium huakuii TaxID=28104 RepID=A0A7G6SVT9_9HYPH|nr:thermonuclease family protein [Mesorhizobium huakuii]QND58621.1 thermonuclease family protein [Mesorhizobium huakuii]
MSWHARMVIAIGGLELVLGIALIMRAGTLLSLDRSVPAPSLQIAGKQANQAAAANPDGQSRGPARRIAESLIAPPPVDASETERVGARPPLGELGLAVRPKTPMPQDWRETLLYHPIATSSATFEAMGWKVVISGAQHIGVDQTCSFRDEAWPCGQRARAAFNAWLRGRALNCFLPPEPERFAIAAPCRLGKQDVGAWLVANGWAMARPGGIYGKAEAIARNAEMGVFGPPR